MQLDAQQWSQPRWPRLLLLPVEPGDVGLQPGHIGLQPGGVGVEVRLGGGGRGGLTAAGREGSGKWRVVGRGRWAEGGGLVCGRRREAHDHSVYRQRSERTERPMTSMSASRH